LAIRIFSSAVIDAPGLCSPSRKVVSNMIKWSGMVGSCTIQFLDCFPRRRLAGERQRLQERGMSYLRAGRSSSSRSPGMAIEESRERTSRKLLMDSL
jgi:hypothetical protein